jgi:predicted RNase H-like nuclease (RuvC/YqgF family)
MLSLPSYCGTFMMPIVAGETEILRRENQKKDQYINALERRIEQLTITANESERLRRENIEKTQQIYELNNALKIMSDNHRAEINQLSSKISNMKKSTKLKRDK